jgi:hypothetical protein
VVPNHPEEHYSIELSTRDNFSETLVPPALFVPNNQRTGGLSIGKHKTPDRCYNRRISIFLLKK